MLGSKLILVGSLKTMLVHEESEDAFSSEAWVNVVK